MEETIMNKIEQAKQVLREAGYYVDNLWCVDDVKGTYECDDDEVAQGILDNALNNGATVEQIWLAISYAAESENLEKIVPADDELDSFRAWLETQVFVDPHMENLIYANFDSSLSYEENFSNLQNIYLK